MPDKLPSPEELKKQSEKAKKAVERRYKREQREAVKAKQERLQKIAEGQFERLTELVQARMIAAAEDGNDWIKVQVNHLSPFGTEARELREALTPVWEQVAEHFNKAGYNTKVLQEPSVEYWRGEPGPGPTTVYIYVAW